MIKQMQEFTNYLLVEKEACTAQADKLCKDSRMDECNLQKIRANIFDIFGTMLSVGCKQSGGDAEKAQQFFLQKLNTIPQSWKISLAAAKKHGDFQKQTAEELKLQTVEQIRKKFAELLEASHD